MYRKNRTLITFLCLIVLGLLLFITACVNDEQEETESIPEQEELTSGQAYPGVEPGLIAEIAEQASPAVVKIDTTVPAADDNLGPFFSDPFFREFFGQPEIMPPQSGPSRRGMGSGFIFSDEGYILTNEHVIRNAAEIRISISDFDKPLDAQVVGSDYDLDLAVLKIDTDQDLPVLELGDSDQTRVGEWVVAIGNPYGLDHTLTVGVISAKGRPVNIEGRYYDNLMQTDASINPGNSGGPLLNLSGEVVAINTAVDAHAQGIGFAIPTSTVVPVLGELIESGGISHAWLGVQLETLYPELAQYLGLNSTRGAFITVVIPDSPAARDGLRPGDVLLRLDAVEVNDPGDVVREIRRHQPGEEITAEIFREGQTLELTMTLGEKPNNT